MFSVSGIIIEKNYELYRKKRDIMKKSIKINNKPVPAPIKSGEVIAQNFNLGHFIKLHHVNKAFELLQTQLSQSSVKLSIN